MAKKSKKKDIEAKAAEFEEKMKAKVAKKMAKKGAKKKEKSKEKVKSKDELAAAAAVEAEKPAEAPAEQKPEPVEAKAPAAAKQPAAAKVEAPAAPAAQTAFPEAAEGEQWKAVSLKMPVSHIAVVDAAAKAYGENGVSRSEFIRIALDTFILAQQAK